MKRNQQSSILKRHGMDLPRIEYMLENLANHLQEQGVKRGDVVGIFAPNDVIFRFIVCFI